MLPIISSQLALALAEIDSGIPWDYQGVSGRDNEMVFGGDALFWSNYNGVAEKS